MAFLKYLAILLSAEAFDKNLPHWMAPPYGISFTLIYVHRLFTHMRLISQYTLRRLEARR